MGQGQRRMRLRRVTARLVGRAAVVRRTGTAAPDWLLASAAALCLLALVETVQPLDEATRDPSTAYLSTAVLLGVCATVPLAVVRTYTLTAATTITIATFLTLASDHRLTVAGLVAELAALYMVGLRRSGRASALFVVPLVAYSIAPFGQAAAPFGQAADGKIIGVVLLTSAVAALGLGGARRAGGEAVVRNASMRAVADTLLEHAARGERARIARELHDVVAHHISMISVQAEAARLATPGMPPEGAKRLAAIGDTARQALTEMRRLLGVLRENTDAEAGRQPQPGLEQLIELVDEARDAARASTRLIVRGRVEPLDSGIELTAYRIVQEALTNARRHAPGAAVDVELEYAGDALRLRVRDNGPGRSGGAEPTGHGLLGMRERATTLGGTLWTGPAPTQGFLVEAVLPTANEVG